MILLFDLRCEFDTRHRATHSSGAILADGGIAEGSVGIDLTEMHVTINERSRDQGAFSVDDFAAIERFFRDRGDLSAGDAEMGRAVVVTEANIIDD